MTGFLGLLDKVVERRYADHANIYCISSHASNIFGTVSGHASGMFGKFLGCAKIFGRFSGCASVFGDNEFSDNGFGNNGVIQQRQLLIHLSCAFSYINAMARTKAILRLQSSGSVGLVGLVGL